MTDLNDLQDLYRLREMMNEREGIDTTSLERDFIAFSGYARTPSLSVVKQQLYSLQGDERTHLLDALTKRKILVRSFPDAVDITGYFDGGAADAVILLSPQQLSADHARPSRSYLNQVIEKMYAEGASTLNDFTVHEALMGDILCKRGELELREAPIFPDRFLQGKYCIEITLDTPLQTISRLSDLSCLIERMAREPKETMLDPEIIERAASEAVALRSKVGALSRYSAPKQTRFSVDTCSCVFDTEETDMFYLYSPSTKRNVLVYFGEQPFKAKKPAALTVLDGAQHEHTLAELVRLGIYAPSLPILTRRSDDLKGLQDAVARGSGGAATAPAEFQRLLDGLGKAKEYMQSVLNEDMRRDYVSRLAPEMLEFMVCPSMDDVALYDLLPRLSWNEAVRNYSDTDGFLRRFFESDEDARKGMLKGVVSNLIFASQQNVTVNNWLYRFHKEFCAAQGINFDVH